MKLFVVLFAFASLVYSSVVPDSKGTKADCLATGVNIGYNKDTLQIAVSWTAPAGCDETVQDYIVEYIVNGDVNEQSPVMPNFPTAMIQLENPLVCESFGIVVVTLGAENAELGRTEETKIPLEPLTLKGEVVQGAGSTVISWEEFNIPDCPITYQVTVNDEAPKPVDGNQFEIPTPTVCTSAVIKVEGIPPHNGLTITPFENTFTVRLPAPVVVPADINAGEASLTFEPLDATTIPVECGTIKYRVMEKSVGCFQSEYSVMAVSSVEDPDSGESTETDGIPDTKVVAKMPTAVLNLRAEVKATEVVLTWNAPVTDESCSFAYSGKILNNDAMLFENIHSTTYTVVYTAPACTFVSASVWAVINEKDGEGTEVSIAGDVDKVENLACVYNADELQMQCAWEKPATCDETAELKYNIVYYDGNRREKLNHEENTFNFITENCSSAWITVQPVLNDKVLGDVAEGTITCSKMTHPNFLFHKSFSQYLYKSI